MKRSRKAKKLLLLIVLLEVSVAGGTAKDEPIPIKEFKERRTRAIAELQGNLLVVPAVPFLAHADSQGFSQDPNFFYLTGLRSELGSILLLDGTTQQSWLFRPAKLEGLAGLFSASETASTAVLDDRIGLDVARLDDFLPYLRRRLSEDPRVEIRIAPTTFDERITASAARAAGLEVSEGWHTRLGLELRKALPTSKIVEDTSLLVPMRQRKSPAEIQALRRAGSTSARGFLAAIHQIRPGLQQRSAEVATLAMCLQEGDGVSFWPWAMSGPVAVYPAPWRSLADPRHLDRIMKAGEVVRVDVGCAVDGYIGDVGRTVPVSGKFSDGQRETWNTLVSSYRAGLAKIRSGVRLDDIVSASFNEIRRLQGQLRTELARKAAATILAPNGAPNWQLHGIGAEVAESLPDVLETGMVLDYEPIFVVDGLGFYLEDMVVVTPTGYELLTPGLPYTAEEVEREMHRAK